jgi:hypothetical protein
LESLIGVLIPDAVLLIVAARPLRQRYRTRDAGGTNLRRAFDKDTVPAQPSTPETPASSANLSGGTCREASFSPSTSEFHADAKANHPQVDLERIEVRAARQHAIGSAAC